MSRLGCLLLFVCCMVSMPRAQTPLAPEAVGDFLFQRWTSKDGLPVDRVTSLAMGPNGYLWAGTADGLVRFDGTRFTPFNVATTPGLTSNPIRWLTSAGDRALWAETNDGAVVRYDGRTFQSVSQDADLPRVYRVVPTEGPSGQVWLLTASGVFQYDAGTVRRVFPSVLQGAAYDAVRAGDQAMWFWTEAGLFRVPPGKRPVRIPLAREDARWPERFGVRSPLLARGPTGEVWAWRYNELAVFRQGRMERVPWATGPEAVIVDLAWDARQRLRIGTTSGWAGLRNGQITLASGVGPKIAFTSADVAPDNALWHYRGQVLYRGPAPVLPTSRSITDVRALLPAGTRSVWGDDDGLFHLRPREIRSLGSEALGGDNAYPVLETRTGDVLVGLWQHSDGSAVVRIREDVRIGAVPVSLPTALHESSDGTVWVGQLRDPVCKLRESTCEPADLPIPDAFLLTSAIAEDRQGRLWLGSDAGLAVGSPDGGLWTATPLASSIRAIVPSASGEMLLASLGSGLGQTRDGQTVEWLGTAEGLASDFVRDVHEDERGVLWIATQDRGLCRLARGPDGTLRNGGLTCFGTEQGLYDESLHRILPDDFGRFWISTNRGLFWVRRADLDAVARGEAERVQSVGYTEQHGMSHREANGARQPAGFRARDGRLWFPTQGGVAIVDPMPPPEAPLARIEAVQIGDREVEAAELASGEIEMSARERDLAVRYTGIEFSRPDAVDFRVRLIGYDEGWREMDDRRDIAYTNLSPGSYTLSVQAGLGGAWSEVASLGVQRRPLFRETGWFVLLALLGIGAVIAGSVWGRTRQLRRRQRQLEATISERTAELKRANEVKSRFLANISHELRTPLALMLGPIRDVLAGRIAPDDSRPHFERAAANGDRLQRLIEDLLSLARLDADALPLRPKHLDLAAFVRTRTAAFTSLAHERGVRLVGPPEAHPPEASGAASPASGGEPLTVAFDPDGIETVLYNLLSNALRFTPEGGEVRVSAGRAEAGGAWFRVTDTGEGIAPEHLAHLFERFYQADTSETRRHEGTGIGLALTHELVRLHGGTITAESTPGEGSTFTVRLLAHPPGLAPTPEAQTAGASGDGLAAPSLVPGVLAANAPLASEADALEPDPPEVSAPDDDRALLLIVEDNADLRAYIRSGLEGPYRVIEAADGARGLALATAEVPDLVLSDVMMPGMDGFALLEALKTDVSTSHIPFVLLTARAGTESRITGLRGGADDYLAKPFDAGELLARVDNLIATRRRLRSLWSSDARHAPEASGEIPGSREDHARGQATDDALPPAEAAFLARVHALIGENLGDAPFGVTELAQALGLSARQFRRKLGALLDETPGALLRHRRVDHAAELLARGSHSVKEAMYATGFTSDSGFRSAFRDRHGVAPSAYTARGADR